MEVKNGFTGAYSNKNEEYMPSINKGGIYWQIRADLPNSYKDWVTRIVGNEEFRNKVEKKIETWFREFAPKCRQFIEIRWDERGISIGNGGDAGVFIDGTDTKFKNYRSDNIELEGDLIILYTGLAVYLKEFFVYLERCERNPEYYSDWPEIRPFSKCLYLCGDQKTYHQQMVDQEGIELARRDRN